ncbi:UNVERIFIED_CONTAM: hypothetical protein Sangu_1919700 [Sesamum angustifolium]|uniref:Uncharacterized protein n=1 Tax=Sesamum angustifolium TaxID=2727405 RepID=A0AAW2LX22_9LAMI
MEAIGAFLDEEWESLSKLFSCEESSDFQLHFDGSNLFSGIGDSPSSSSTLFAAAENVAAADGSLFFLLILISIVFHKRAATAARTMVPISPVR